MPSPTEMAAVGHAGYPCRSELVEAILTPNPSGERLPDELYARASAYYDTKARPVACL